MANFPNTSFMNLFKNIVYDPTQTPNYSLDIWDAYTISPFYKNELKYFQLHVVNEGETWISLAQQYYGDERLWWIIPLFNDIDDPFVVMNKQGFPETVTQLKILQQTYLNMLLITARQQKIMNDRETAKGV